jgi:hypothetical protein
MLIVAAILALVRGLSLAPVQDSNDIKVSVSSPQQLLQALKQQVPHIVITKHMDVSETFTTSSTLGDGKKTYTSASGRILTSGTKKIEVLLFRLLGRFNFVGNWHVDSLVCICVGWTVCLWMSRSVTSTAGKDVPL